MGYLDTERKLSNYFKGRFTSYGKRGVLNIAFNLALIHKETNGLFRHRA
jgi:hypothetical protein